MTDLPFLTQRVDQERMEGRKQPKSQEVGFGGMTRAVLAALQAWSMIGKPKKKKERMFVGGRWRRRSRVV